MALQVLNDIPGRGTSLGQSVGSGIGGALDAIVKMMVENPTFKLKIGGHTDDVGNDGANMTLSQNRADAVAKYLIAHGVAPNRVAATGYGETKPVSSNKTKAGQARNRRVELELEYTE